MHIDAESSPDSADDPEDTWRKVYYNNAVWVCALMLTLVVFWRTYFSCYMETDKINITPPEHQHATNDVLLRNPYATRIFKMTISESARIGTAVPTSNNSVPTTTGTTTTHFPDGSEDVLLSNPDATRIFKMTISESARIGTAVPTSNNSVPTTTGTTTTHFPDGSEEWIWIGVLIAVAILLLLVLFMSCLNKILSRRCKRKNYDDISDRPFKRGLRNVGNTCYFNVAMQCLLSTPILKSQVAASARNKEVTNAFIKFLSPIDPENSSVSTALDPRPLLRAFCAKVTRFRGSEQHDSHELLRHFLDQLRQEERASWTTGIQPKALTAVDKVFGGHLMTVYICKKCKTPYHICEPFLDISVPICLVESSGSQTLEEELTKESEPESASPYQEAIASIMERLSDRSVDLPSKILSITDYLRYFTRQEKLGQQYLCNSCAYNPASATLDLPEVQKLTVATKQTLIFNPPAVLVIHLKRFEMKKPRFEKRTNKIIFEELLDLAPYCSSWCLRNEHHERNIWYSLYGVVVHSGSLNSGHYVAYIKERNEYKDIDKFLQKKYFDRDVTVDQLVEMMQELNKTGRKTHPTEGIALSGIWYCMNDSRVSKVFVDEVLRQEAFLLFYERVSPI